MSIDNPAHRYRVQLCAGCFHPGGQHFGGSCALCSCETWAEGSQAWWSDLDTEAALSG